MATRWSPSSARPGARDMFGGAFDTVGVFWLDALALAVASGATAGATASGTTALWHCTVPLAVTGTTRHWCQWHREWQCHSASECQCHSGSLGLSGSGSGPGGPPPPYDDGSGLAPPAWHARLTPARLRVTSPSAWPRARVAARQELNHKILLRWFKKILLSVHSGPKNLLSPPTPHPPTHTHTREGLTQPLTEEGLATPQTHLRPAWPVPRQRCHCTFPLQ